MQNIILGVLLAIAVLSAAPIPTKVLTVKAWTYSIVESASTPSGSQIFEDEKEVLASITSFYDYGVIFSIEMSTVSSTN
jgi:hypothetical protein